MGVKSEMIDIEMNENQKGIEKEMALYKTMIKLKDL